DVNLAYRRHYPSINWLTSFSLYVDNVTEWWSKISHEYSYLREKFMKILQREAELEELVRLVGADALPVEDRLTLEVARIIREDFLQQDAFNPVDAFSHPVKTVKMAIIIDKFYENALEAIKLGVPFEKIRGMKIRERIARMRYIPFGDNTKEFDSILVEMEEEFKNLREGSR
ncbi:MAG: V-type ATP synthase subunit A, partial [Desulfurococcus sp.]